MTDPEMKIVTDAPPTLEEAQEFVGGYVEMQTLPDGRQMLWNEDARMFDLPYNPDASKLWGRGSILGNVLVLEGAAKWR